MSGASPTKRLYWDDPMLQRFEATVLEAGKKSPDGVPVVLDRTAFYPEGGGQPPDEGMLGEAEVLDVREEEGRIIHRVDRPLAAGEKVEGSVNWARRWDHMQQHTGQHVLTSVALRDFGWRTTAFHLGDEWSDIELDPPRLDRDELDRLEQAVSKEIFAARSVSFRSAEVSDFERLGVRSRLLPEGFEGSVRLVDIEGLDLNTCGGTHCRSTAEIGLLCLLGTEPMRGGTRVFFVAGDRVRRRMAAHEERNLRLRSLLDTGDQDLPEAVMLRLKKEKELARTARLLAEELAHLAAKDLASETTDVVQAHWRDRDMAFLQQTARALADAAPEKRALLTSESAGTPLFVVVAGRLSGLRLDETGPRIAAALGGRGGGRGTIYQGKVDSLENRDEALRILREA